jgi:hypothetical protein
MARVTRAPGATPEHVTYALGIVEARARVARDLAREAVGSPRIDEPRPIGRVVRGVAEQLRVEAERRSLRLEVDGDDSGPVSAARDLEQAEHVGLDHLAPRFAGAFGDLLGAAREAGVVDQHVDRSVRGDRCGHEALDAGGHGDVECVAERVRRHVAQAIAAARTERQAVAELEEGVGASSADAGAGAGDDDVAGHRRRIGRARCAGDVTVRPAD